jgi:hypothetical protein
MSELNDFEKILGVDKIKSMRENAKLKRMSDGKGCALCDYTGYTTSDDGKAAMCSCLKEQFFKELFHKANVPKAFWNKTVADWNTRTDSYGKDLGAQQNISEKIYSLLSFYERNLVKICRGKFPKLKHTYNVVREVCSIHFEGGIGSGKSFIAAVIVQSAIRRNLSAKYYDWTELLQILTDFEKKEQADEVLEEFKELDLVAIDGIEIYSYNHPQLSIHLDRISKARLHSGKPILLFSNGNAQQISTGSGWNSLLKSCLTIRLPYIK